jgi:hypothetical protein
MARPFLVAFQGISDSHFVHEKSSLCCYPDCRCGRVGWVIFHFVLHQGQTIVRPNLSRAMPIRPDDSQAMPKSCHADQARR